MRTRYVLLPSDIESIRARVKNWGGLCLICGEPFRTVLSVTRDHVIPKSVVIKNPRLLRYCRANIAPAHYRCNNFKQSKSLIQTAKELGELKAKWGIEKFHDWINKRTPCRYAEPGTDISF